MNPLYTKALFIGILVSIFATETLAQTLIVESTPSTSCSPPNGTLSASVDGGYVGYSFAWYSGHDTSGEVFTISPVVTHLFPGIYTIQVTNDTTSEILETRNVLVLDNTVMPEYSITIISANTSCNDDYVNGSLAVVLAGDADPGGYTFTWNLVEGGPTYIDQPNDTIKDLVAGTYTVEVIDTATQCSQMAQATILNEPSNLSVNIISTDVSSCVSPNGTLTAEVEGDSTSNYNFEWFEGTIAEGAPIGYTNTLDSLSASLYTVKVLDLLTSCMSIATDSISLIFPTFPSVQVTHFNSCSGISGSLSVVGLDEGQTDFSFALIAESGDTLSTEMEISAIPAGNYVFVIKHIASGCEEVTAITIENQTTLLTASVDVLSHRTQCQYADGSLSAVVEGSPSDYDFAWFMGAAISFDTIAFTQTINQLAAGEYSVLISNNISGCDTLITAVVRDSTTIPASVITTPVTSCVSPNGSASAEVHESDVNYTYVWYRGSGISEDTLAITPSITALSPDAYTVVIKDTATWCSTMITTIVSDQTMLPAANVSVLSHFTSCDLPDGSLTVQLDSVQNYSYQWFEGTEVIDTVYATSQTITELTAGTYTVQVTDELTGCVSVMTGTVYDIRTMPEIITEVLSPETSCLAPDGALVVRPASVDTARHYRYEWYGGTSATGSIISENDTIIGLSTGMYTVLAVDTLTQCMQAVSVEINSEVVIPELAVEITSTVTSCLVPNGSASVLGEDLADYTFLWFEGTTPNSSVLSTHSTITNLSPGIYGVTYTHKLSGCANTVSIAVLDERVYPVASITNNEDVLSTEDIDGYQYQWFFDGAQLDDTDHEITATESGDYSVVVISELGCASEPATLHFEKRVITRNETLQSAQRAGYPNPTNGLFWIKADHNPKADFVITDTKGKVLVTKKILKMGETFEIDLSLQPAGVYVLKSVTKTGTHYYRVVKN